MLKATSKRVLECWCRADECRLRADTFAGTQWEPFWREQEARWKRLAEHSEFAERIDDFVAGREASCEAAEAAEGALATLLDIYMRVCAALGVEPGEQQRPRQLTHAIVRAALAGEDDPEAIYAQALKALSH